MSCPKAICMMCGRECERSEEVEVEPYRFDLWCYCDRCDVDTFHPIPSPDPSPAPLPGAGHAAQ